MLALHRSGRQADALACYQRHIRMLRDELGLDPCPELQALHEAILRRSLGLARIRTALTAALLPGLALQGVAAALGGVSGAIAAFAAINIALGWRFLTVIRRSTAAADHRARAAEPAHR